MKKALIVTWEKYQDHEVIYPYYRVLEEGFEVDIMSNVKGKIFGILGTYMESTRTVDELHTDYDSIMDEYDFLVKLRQEQQVLDFINDWNSQGKTIACICHGGQMLISAKITDGRDVSGYYSIKDDLINSGGNFVDAPAVVSDNLVSCPHYKWMGQWMLASFEVYNKWVDNLSPSGA